MSKLPVLGRDDLYFAVELIRADLHHLREVIDLATTDESPTESIHAYEALYERAESRLHRFELAWRNSVTHEHTAGRTAVGGAA